MAKHESISYLEFPCRDLAATKAFFEKCFGWSFTDYGPDYTSFSSDSLDGGFYHSELAAGTRNGSALVVFYSRSLEETLSKLEAAGAKVVKPIFSFPGGRRFHFTEPSGNEFAVWSDAGLSDA